MSLSALGVSLFFAAVASPLAEASPDAPAATEAAAWQHYGAPFQSSEPIAAATLLADPAPHVGKTVLVEGRVADVCSKMGCWMVVAAGDQTMRVLMKDHAFSVDKQGAGKTCRIEGVVTAKAVDPETVAHFASESRKTEVMPEKGKTAGATVYELVASGVAMSAAKAD